MTSRLCRATLLGPLRAVWPVVVDELLKIGEQVS
jgi:hypothetical protein